MSTKELDKLLSRVGESVGGIMADPDAAYERIARRRGIPEDIDNLPIDVAESVLGLLQPEYIL